MKPGLNLRRILRDGAAAFALCAALALAAACSGGNPSDKIMQRAARAFPKEPSSDLKTMLWFYDKNRFRTKFEVIDGDAVQAGQGAFREAKSGEHAVQCKIGWDIEEGNKPIRVLKVEWRMEEAGQSCLLTKEIPKHLFNDATKPGFEADALAEAASFLQAYYEN